MSINRLGFGIAPVSRVGRDGKALHQIIDLATGAPLVIHTKRMVTEQACAAVEQYVKNNLDKLETIRKSKNRSKS